MKMLKNKKLNEIIKLIKSSNKIAIFHHVFPDGDALSSSYGLVQVLKQKFPKKVIKWLPDKKNIKKLFSYIVDDFSDSIEEIDETWTAIIGDTAVFERIYLKEQFKKANKKICFDHHQNNINFKTNVYMSHKNLGASSVQVYMIAKKLKIKFTNHIAISILFGILTDTFYFTHSLNDIRPLEAAKDLLSFINKITIDNVYKNLKKRTIDDIKFQKYVLNNMKIKKNVSYFKLNDKNIKKLGIDIAITKKPNLIGNIENVKIWIFIIEDKKNKILRISLRSNGFNVSKIAKKFGGGGHKRAAGIKIKIDWKKANKIIEIAQKELINCSKYE